MFKLDKAVTRRTVARVIGLVGLIHVFYWTGYTQGYIDSGLDSVSAFTRAMVGKRG